MINERRPARGAVVLLFVAACALAACAPAVLPASASDPAAPGPFGVGFISRTFTRTLANGQTRKLAVDIWYPGQAGSGLPDPEIHASLQVAPANKSRHPLLVFSHGYGATPFAYSLFLSHLASHGFVVAAPEHDDCSTSPCNAPTPYSQPITRDQIDRRLEDIPWVLDNLLALNDQQDPTLGDLVNPNQVGLAGQSFGAWMTLTVTQTDPRFRAGLAMNPGTLAMPPDPAKVTTPTLLMAGELDALVDFGTTETFFTQIPPTAPDHYLLLVPRAGHEFANDCSPGLSIVGCSNVLTQDQLNAIMDRVGTAFLLRYVADESGYAQQLDQGGTADYALIHTLTGATPMPFPTPAPIPFPTPSAVPAPAPVQLTGNIILRDTGNLLPATPGGPDQYVAGYDKGEFVIRTPMTLLPNATFLNQTEVILPGTYSDVTISVDARLVSPDIHQFAAVGCRSADAGSQYRLLVFPATGTFGLVRLVGGVATTLMLKDNSAAVHIGNETNNIQITCNGSVLDATLNGVHVASVTDGTFRDGGVWIGLGHVSGVMPAAASSPLSRPIEGHFTNLTVLQP